jgi:hypothetical protein
MRERLMIAVSFDPVRGYVAVHDDLPSITALSLSVLRQRVERHLGVDAAAVRLVLDKRARSERDQRRRGGAPRAGDYSAPR